MENSTRDEKGPNRADTETGSVHYACSEEGVARLTFAHPARNAMPGALLARLADAVEQASADDRARVVVLASGGERTFCAGANFNEFRAIADEEAGHRFFMGFARVINTLRACPKIIIGRVQGKAVGGGVGLAAATDYCLASTFASVKLSELAMGIGPFVVGPAVARKVGQAGLAELAIDAENWRSAEWALQRGLYAEIFESNAELDEAVDNLAHRLAGYNPEAMAALKQSLWTGTEHWPLLLEERARKSGRLVLSAYTKRALKAFDERKKQR